jgi:hypothetical protein
MKIEWLKEHESRRPTGSITIMRARLTIGPIYRVYADGKLERFATIKEKLTFMPQYEWYFNNYFHAYAYSLKCKAHYK